MSRILLALACVGAAGLGNARAETGYLAYTYTGWVYQSGPFDSYEAGADDAVVDYTRHFPLPGLEWQSCGTAPASGLWNPYLRYHPTTGGQSGCFDSLHAIAPQTCPAGQLPQWAPSITCQDFRPFSCTETNPYWDGQKCVETCPPERPEVFLGSCVAKPAFAKNAGPGQCCDQWANPIKPGTGQKYQQEVVLRTPTFALELTYNSTPVDQMPLAPYPFGKGWSFNYGMRVWVIAQNTVATLRPGGKFYQFLPPAAGNVYIAEADVPDTLTKLVDATGTLTGWQYRVGQDESVETYDADGRLIAIVQRNAQNTTLTYSTPSTPSTIAPRAGLLISVTDHFEWSLQFTYDSSARVTRVTDPAGSQTNFNYDAASSLVLSGQPLGGNLTSIAFPDLRQRSFYRSKPSEAEMC